jgi:8-oxo-dGTP pyrophosphatase MutT (NUDIX family)
LQVMTTEIDIHKIQKNIIFYLLFNKNGRFSDLNTKNISSDKFNFHLKRLIVLDLVTKTGKGRYNLTPKGKEFANRMDTDNKVYKKQAKLGVLIVLTKEKGGITKYLLQQRLKVPYYGYWGFVTGKAKIVETVFETAKRELDEETGYDAKLALTGIKHKMDYSKENKLLEDKFFFVIRASKPKGKLKSKFKGGKNKWLSEKEILSIENLFDGVRDSINIAMNNKL